MGAARRSRKPIHLRRIPADRTERVGFLLDRAHDAACRAQGDVISALLYDSYRRELFEQAPQADQAIYDQRTQALDRVREDAAGRIEIAAKARERLQHAYARPLPDAAIS